MLSKALCSIVVLVCLSIQCKQKSETVYLKAFFSEYLMVYWVTQNPTAAHSVQVTGPDGTVWYRNAEPMLDLSQIIPESFQMFKEGRAWSISFLLEEPHSRRFQGWTERHVGEYLAVMIDGEVVYVAKVLSSVGPALRVPIGTRERAEEILAILQDGGIKGTPPATASAPG